MAVASRYLEAMAGFQNNYILSCQEDIQVRHSVQVLGICYAIGRYRRMQTGIWLGNKLIHHHHHHHFMVRHAKCAAHTECVKKGRVVSTGEYHDSTV